MLTVLYDVSLLCNLARSVGNLSVFPARDRFEVSGFGSVFCVIVAISYELRLSTRGFLAIVHAVVSSRS